MKILICDDSITIRKKLSQSLKGVLECEIFEAENGIVAIEKYKSERPDVTFMDIVMPEKTGIEAVAEIVLFDANAKVIMLSSVGTKENLKEALEAGAVDFIQKPWDDKMLHMALDKFKRKE